MVSIFYSLVILMQVTALLSTSPPKCKPSDAECLKAAAQAMTKAFADGMPELDTEPLDVMRVNNIKVDLAGLKLNISNADIKGLRNAVIDKVRVDMEKKLLQIVFHTDVSMKGKYKAAGRLLILPISGDGDVDIDLKNYQLDLTIPFTIVKNNQGRKAIDMKEFKAKFDVRDNAHYQLTNLFNGNKILSDAMLKFMNDNWKVLSQEFGGTLLVKPNKKIHLGAKKSSHPCNFYVDANCVKVVSVIIKIRMPYDR